MMKVLIISLCAPYDARRDAGGKTHNYYVKRLAQEKDCELRLLSFCEENDYDEAMEDLKSYSIDADVMCLKTDLKYKICRNIISVNSRFNPFSQYGCFTYEYYWHGIKQKLIKLKLNGYQPDVIILSWTQIGLFVDRIKKIYPDSKFIVSEHDVSYHGYERKTEIKSGIAKVIWRIRTRNLKKSELRMANAADLTVVHNINDRQLLIEDGIPQEKIHVIVPYYDDYSLKVTRQVNWNAPNLIYYGAMSRPENYECAIRYIERILPYLKSQPKFYVIGNAPHAKLEKYRSEQVVISGFVQDITPYLENCLCLIAPLTMGAGIKVKMIEMMSAGVPVITNQIGIEGIPVKASVDYIHCESDDEFIAALDKILSREVDIETMGDSARNAVKQIFDIHASGDALAERIRRIIAGPF